MAKRFERAKAYTQKYRSLLAPCTYCGNEEVLIVSDRTMFTKPRDGWSVVCSTPNCDCTAIFTSVKAAMQSWNARHGGVIITSSKGKEEKQ